MQSITYLGNATLLDPTPNYNQYLSAVQARSHWSYEGNTYYEFLAKLMLRLRPKKILELGTGTGKSAFFMMTTLPTDSTIITIDNGPPYPIYQGSDMGQFAQDHRLTLLNGNDLDPAIRAKVNTNYDLLYIDSDHTYEQACAEWALYRPVLVDGAVVLIDDIRLNAGMKRFWEELHYDKYDCGGIHASGFGMFRYII